MKNTILLYTLALAIIGVPLLVIATIVVVLNSAQCRWKWEDSGMESRFLYLSGCQVKTETGWINDTHFRTME